MNKNLNLTKLLSLTLIATAITSSLLAVEPTPSGKALPAPPDYQLVFSDHFSTDPNSNGQWTVFRRQGNLNEEGYWDSAAQAWDLTRQNRDLATAAFANYELTAKVWKVDFKYRVDSGPGGADGFVFMFYKDKGAYGTPDSGTYMGFQTRNRNGTDNRVRGYGLQFDTYQYSSCDPLLENYVAIVQDAICDSALIFRPFAKIDDSIWHAVEFTFDNGRITCAIDGKMVQGLVIGNPDYTYSGVGFGAGTGTETSNQIIDDFELWVAADSNK